MEGTRISLPDMFSYSEDSNTHCVEHVYTLKLSSLVEMEICIAQGLWLPPGMKSGKVSSRRKSIEVQYLELMGWEYVSFSFKCMIFPTLLVIIITILQFPNGKDDLFKFFSNLLQICILNITAILVLTPARVHIVVQMSEIYNTDLTAFQVQEGTLTFLLD